MQKVTVFDFENDNMFEYDFTQNIPVLIYNGEYVDYNVKLIYTTNTDFSKRCRYDDEVMV